jgi:hypothetical protein
MDARIKSGHDEIIPATHSARVMPKKSTASRNRGRGECRVPDAPAASRAKKTKHTSVVTARFTGETRHSRTRMVLTVSFALSSVTGLSCHRHPQEALLLENLTPASGRQDHTTSPSALAPLVSRRRRVHRIPHPTSVTIAIRPSCEAGRAKDAGDLGFRQSEIFFLAGLDR